jgi:hypothetical protein
VTKSGDINYLNSEALGNLTDFGFKCRYFNTINRITLEDGELNKQEIILVCFFLRQYFRIRYEPRETQHEHELEQGC